tara:strand:+ start:223 stop:654 length:432 start_codon:yes stop_codon:yes gene_type:complete
MANPSPSTEISTQVDLRLDIDGSTYNLQSISGESVALSAITSADTTAYKIGYLQERPAVANFSSSNAAPVISGLTLVATLASLDDATKFYVDYERAFILLLGAYGSSSVSITYSGMGTVMRSLEVNNCLAEIGQATAMAIALG